jgi:hypothetical protein
MRSRFGLGLTVGFVAAALTVSATNVMAGNGIGAVFNLGKTNKVSHVSALRGSTSSALLQVTNTGVGPALKLTVKAGAAPLQVSSETRVAHLNADKIDGFDSTAFRKAADPVDAATLDGLDSTAFRKVADPVDAATLDGKASASFVQTDAGVVQQVRRGRLSEPLGSGNGGILAITGFGSIEASCGSGGVPNYRLFWRNTSGGVADGWFADSSTTTTYQSPANGSGFYVAPLDTATDRIVTVTIGLPSGAVATVTVSAHASAGGCVFYAQAVAG